ncbi:MAG TPA: hypothetical protein VNY30_06755 [Bryobacteraceae bacterium]|jgi:hypothetical protein|nr:hypothetical protein [Bryobacteraceae bacterium]
MSSGNAARPHWSLALAGIQAGTVGALILLGYLALDSAWHRHSIWTVPNLLASTFYGESAYRQGFSAGTSVGVALLLLLYGALGLLFALVVRDHGTRMRVVLAGLIYGTGWFFLSFDILWKHVNPMVQIYSPDRAMLVGHVLYGGVLGRGFPAYLQSIRGAETPAAPGAPVELPPPGIEGPTAT